MGENDSAPEVSIMARPKSVASLTIAELESILKERRGQIPKLQKERRRILKELAELDLQLGSLGGRRRGRKPGRGRGRRGRLGRPRLMGTRMGRRGRRPKNAKSLIESIHDVLARRGAPMTVGDIMNAVKGNGYKSSSANFRGIVNQTLIKDKQFKSAARGTYGLR
jgi:hypothetical protein